MRHREVSRLDSYLLKFPNMTNSTLPPFRRGYITIVGRPNVGKSTLVNRILERKLSITSRKPQTTRHRILGIKTTKICQAIYLDTPGLDFHTKGALNRYMNRMATGAMIDVDLVLFVVEAQRWTELDEDVRIQLPASNPPVILVINKIDQVKDKQQLLPFLDEVNQDGNYKEIVPLSARRGNNVALLEELVAKNLPEGEMLFPEDQITDRSKQFFASELIREKLTRSLGQEVPYRLAVEIEHWSEKQRLISIDAVIWVERAGQKAIVIGKQGQMLKAIASKARLEMEDFFGKKIFLRIWTKVRSGWSTNDAALRMLHYDE
uniref:GTPase Era n=1 Tax=Candidatus Kentrum sp. TUN TaxID=2126343 RepID=A0A450ZWW9_9GAMM|nr:MAG: GTP-binding protein Era [Candidatus Kentron sp. TUN]VFK61726.1 MAG: GTP-binding protein Era [Candidatus Kentron sp. TUN]VFK67156.1 MAG: GTP-binding protein Era [Candidatus Kentron sp. TUN]